MDKLTIKNLDLYYSEFKALKNINLNIQEKEITAFIGPSGCGKSTLLKSLNRMNDLVEGCRIEGEVLLDGEDIYKDMDVNLLCRDLCAAFCMEEMADYLLSVPDQNGFPVEYSARGSKRSINKANGKDLQDLPIEAGSKLMLYPTQNRTMALSLEIVEKGKGNPYLMYPRVTKQSPKIIEQEKIDEIF